MEVIYNNKPINNNDFLKLSEVQKQPEINLDLDKSKNYLLVMYDPDAVVPVVKNKLHWLLTNIINNNINQGRNILPYEGPAPPPKSGKHHYIFELYDQEDEYLDPIESRYITIDDLKNKLNLSNPIYKIQFISENPTGGKRRRTRKSKRSKKRKTNKKRKRIN